MLVASTLERVVEALDGRSLDAVVCMGVLEHLPLRERARFFDFCARHLAPRGRVVIDVPVEIGPTLLVKQFGRRVLKRRGREYGPGELLGAVAGRRTVDPNRHGAGSDPDFIYTHKGFDHRVFRKELERPQEIIEEVVTPLRRPPSWLGNQEVIYVSRPRVGAAGREELSARPDAGG